MMSRYATVDEIVYQERKNRSSEGVRSRTPSAPSESLHDDLDGYQQIDSKGQQVSQEAAEEEVEERRSISSDRRRPSS